MWSPYRAPIDFFLLQDVVSPGIAVFRDGKTKNKIEVRHPLGAGGAFVIYNGRDLTDITATLTFDSQDDFELWPAFRQVVDTPPGGIRPKALSIVHPILADIGVTAVLVEGRSQLTPADDGSWTVDIYFKQFKRPKRMRAAPAGAKKKKAQEEDAQDKKIRELAAQEQDLSDQLAETP